MSRIGRLPIQIPDGVEVQINPGSSAWRVRKGELEQAVSPDLSFEREDSKLVVKRPTDRGEHRALHGLTRSLVATWSKGSRTGFEKRLEIQGVGYRAQLKGDRWSWRSASPIPVRVDAPEGIEFEVPVPTQVIVRGIDKQAVGEVAARIRKFRPPEPYKGKGVRYVGEHVARKVGKRA